MYKLEELCKVLNDIPEQPTLVEFYALLWVLQELSNDLESIDPFYEEYQITRKIYNHTCKRVIATRKPT